MPLTSRLFASAVAACALGLAGRVAAQSSSPFMPASGADAVVGAPVETIEFAGVNIIGKKTLINLYDKTAKKSRWIPLHETIDGLNVMAYDSQREQVVVKIGSEQKLLTLRKANGTANAPTLTMGAPSPAMNFNVPTPPPAGDPATANSPPPLPTVQPAPVAPVATAPAANPAKPDEPVKAPSVAKQEEEARMLVSDLLEIGMAQRKAYEEAQKKAATAEQNGASTPPPQPATQPRSGGE